MQREFDDCGEDVEAGSRWAIVIKRCTSVFGSPVMTTGIFKKSAAKKGEVLQAEHLLTVCAV